jgi:hypothetical protein
MWVLVPVKLAAVTTAGMDTGVRRYDGKQFNARMTGVSVLYAD